MKNNNRVDYIGMWFRARLRHGIRDDMSFGVLDPHSGKIDWHVLPHRRFDGLGGLAHLLRSWGLDPELPELAEKRPPSWWRLLLAMLAWRDPDVPPPRWRTAVVRNDPAVPERVVDWFDRAETEMIRRKAREQNVSVTVLLLWTLHQVVTRNLLREGTRGDWLLPVNMRGPVRLASDEMNHSSGFYLPVDGEWSPTALREEIRTTLRARRHWAGWRLARIGRLVGQWGVNHIHDRLAHGPGHLGSFSMLGEWEQDMAAAGWSPESLLCCTGPGSPTHPVSNGAIIWNGRLTLTLQTHPVLGVDETLLRRCMNEWRGLLLDPLAREVAA